MHWYKDNRTLFLIAVLLVAILAGICCYFISGIGILFSVRNC